MSEMIAARTSSLPGQIEVGVLDGVGNHHVGQPVIALSPRFQLLIFLEGEQQFYIDDVYFRLSSESNRGRSPKALVMNRIRGATLRHVEQPQQYLRKVMISAPVSWMEDIVPTDARRYPELADFVSGHLNHFVWIPPRYAVQLAQEIADPPPTFDGELRELFRKAKAMELMCLACSALVERDREQIARPSLTTWRQSERVRDYLLEHLDEPLTIDQIARETGGSVSAIQRHFKEHFGVTVFEFLRARRLEKARDALERTGATIAQAAYIAGYANPSNFTTAFKKAYGIAPKYHRC